jgi:superoxide dismutase, Cu-Zn family
MKNPFKNKITRTLLFGTAILSISFFACKKDKTEDEVTPTDIHKSALANIQKVYNDTAVSGTATFSQINNGDVTLTLDITVPSRANKSVAVHLHMMNDCGGNANNAMGHWNPTNTNHGKFGTGSFHLGDIGNIDLDKLGHATYVMTTNAWNINGTDTLRNVVGRSIIIHSGVDDYTTQPSGNSGNRIGCGGILIN